MEIKEIRERMKAANIDTLRIDFPDVYGICRSKMMPAKRLEELAEEGINFAQAAYALDLANDVAAGTGLGYEIEWKDMTIKPDLNTFAVLPYLEGTARLIGNAYRQGEPHPVDPRYVGTALTVQTCLGFLLTLLTIRIVPFLTHYMGWKYVFGILAFGPIFGVWSMLRLRKLPEAFRMASGHR